MPHQVETPQVRVSRQSVRILWSAYAGGLALCALLMAVGAADPGGVPERWTVPQILCASVGAAAAIASWRLMRGLPQAGHRIFDTVGQRFAFAMRHLFLRFVLAGATAELSGLMGAVAFVLGGPVQISVLLLATGFGLLLYLRQRVAPLVHYLA